ncbi:acyltransferase family protein [Pseudomonas nitroreducens]|uniref:acyltransferase family protein n=1 Tax=Pseudomonas nitroreducens TaxID=46680 RepID=UPI0028AC5B46|nr:acyltransferase [Pseudomonas nitroreducens]
MHSSNIKFLPQIDHLRAIAAIWIVAYHGFQLIGAVAATGSQFSGAWVYTDNPLYSAIIEGHSAVALFMVLSGFIFTFGAFGKSLYFSGFIRNRILRIYPMYAFVLVCAVATSQFQFSAGRLIASILPFADFYAIQGTPFMAVSWAVAVELQFYLVFPIILFYLNKNPLSVLLSIVVGFNILRALCVLLGMDMHDVAYWHIIGRMDQFAFGAAAAVLLRMYRVGKYSSAVGLAVSVVFVFVMLQGFNRMGGWPSSDTWRILWPSVEGAVYASLIYFYVSSGLLSHGFFSNILCKVGECSFSIYLLHFPVVKYFSDPKFMGFASGRPFVETCVLVLFVVIPAVIVISFVTYRIIERPFLRRRVRYTSSVA